MGEEEGEEEEGGGSVDGGGKRKEADMGSVGVVGGWVGEEETDLCWVMCVVCDVIYFCSSSICSADLFSPFSISS